MNAHCIGSEVSTGTEECQNAAWETEVAASPGQQLDSGRARDRHRRQAEAELAQSRITSAHRAETWARSACVAVGLLPVGLLLIDAGIAAGTFGDEAGALARLAAQVFAAVLMLVMWLLPALAMTAVLAWRWRLHLIRAATEQELAVRDPGKVDYS